MPIWSAATTIYTRRIGRSHSREGGTLRAISPEEVANPIAVTANSGSGWTVEWGGYCGRGADSLYRYNGWAFRDVSGTSEDVSQRGHMGEESGKYQIGRIGKYGATEVAGG